MSELARIGVAIDSALLDQFDAWIAKRGYTNRSEAFRDMIRDGMIRDDVAAPDAETIGSLTLIYDHHQRLLTDKLNEVQHDHHERIISTLHVHLDHDACLEVLILKGTSSHVRDLAHRIISLKGVKHGQLVLTSVARTVK